MSPMLAAWVQRRAFAYADESVEPPEHGNQSRYRGRRIRRQVQSLQGRRHLVTRRSSGASAKKTSTDRVKATPDVFQFRINPANTISQPAA